MATNHTENYALNLWEPTDSFLREEFNENFTKLDTAVAGRAQAVFGTYVGTGIYGEGHPTGLDFADSVGRAPLFLFVHPDESAYQLILVNGMTRYAVYHGQSKALNDVCAIVWTETGVSWTNSTHAELQLNKKDMIYHYIALF